MNKSKPDTKIQSPDYCMTTLFSLQPDAYSLTLGNHYTRLKIYKHILKRNRFLYQENENEPHVLNKKLTSLMEIINEMERFPSFKMLTL